jgi:hypothetical protein
VFMKKQITNRHMCVACTFPSTPPASVLRGKDIHITDGHGNQLHSYFVLNTVSLN